MARKFYPSPTHGYRPPPGIPELPLLINPDLQGIRESRDQVILEDRLVVTTSTSNKTGDQPLKPAALVTLVKLAVIPSLSPVYDTNQET